MYRKKKKCVFADWAKSHIEKRVVLPIKSHGVSIKLLDKRNQMRISYTFFYQLILYTIDHIVSGNKCAAPMYDVMIDAFNSIANRINNSFKQHQKTNKQKQKPLVPSLLRKRS